VASNGLGRPVKLRGPDDLGPESLTDALVAEADAEEGDLAAQLGHHGQTDTALFGPTRTGGDDHRIGLLGPDPGDVDGVVAEDDGIGPELTQGLDEVVGEGVVIVDEQDARGGHPTNFRGSPESERRAPRAIAASRNLCAVTTDRHHMSRAPPATG